uniref:Putative VRR-NUC domain-containing protein n=1 Tax=viral metagenome TaxID=1070528 RepID=A0A6M3JEU8_9ZZZZ
MISEAENQFRRFIAKKKGLTATKKGLPDFMIIKKGKIVAFVEVKKTDLYDELRPDQILFKDFCKEHNIPYQVWSPMMANKMWKRCRDTFKNAMTYGGEIWEKI